MRSALIEVVDHGSGNCGPLQACLRLAGFNVVIRSNLEASRSADALILPGVGNFGFGMRTLRSRGLDQYICDWAASGSPLVGICLGMQMLFQTSDEGKGEKGLNLLEGSSSALDHGGFHIGWNHTTFIGQPRHSGDYFYNHSFHVNTRQEYVAGTVDFEGKALVASVRCANIYGFQFHPEKSQDQGLALLRSTLQDVLDG